MLNKIMIFTSYVISGIITLMFMLDFSEGNGYLMQCICFGMGIVLELAKIRFTYLCSRNPSDRANIAIASLLILTSVFFSFLFTSNMAMSDREEGKEITQEYEDYTKKIENLNADKERLITEKDNLLEQQTKEINELPVNWVTSRQEVKDSYKASIEAKEKSISEIIQDIDQLKKPTQYKYTITKGFNPQSIKNSPVIGNLVKDLPDILIIQTLAIFFGLMIEIVGVYSTFLEGKRQNIKASACDEDIKTEKLKTQIANISEQANKQVEVMEQASKRASEQASKQAELLKQASKQADEQAREQAKIFENATIGLAKRIGEQITSISQSKASYGIIGEQTSILSSKQASKQAIKQVDKQASEQASILAEEPTQMDTRTSTDIINDYPLMEKILKILKEYKGEKVPKKLIMETFGLTPTRYRKIAEYLKTNSIISSTGNGYIVN